MTPYVADSVGGSDGDTRVTAYPHPVSPSLWACVALSVSDSGACRT